MINYVYMSNYVYVVFHNQNYGKIGKIIDEVLNVIIIDNYLIEQDQKKKSMDFIDMDICNFYDGDDNNFNQNEDNLVVYLNFLIYYYEIVYF